MTDRDVERQLAAALRALDREPAPVALRERVLAITSIEPVRASVTARTRYGRGTTVLAAAAALIAVLAGTAFVGGGAEVVGPLPTASIVTNLEPTAAPLPTHELARVSLVTWPANEPALGSLEPGDYALPKPYGVSAYRHVVLTLPPGWTFGAGILSRRLGQPAQLAIAAGPIDAVHADPCHWQSSPPEDFHHHHGEIDGTFIDTAAQLGQLDPGVPVVEVDLGGVYAQRLQMTIPATLDLSACDGGEFRRWDTRSGTGHPSDAMSLPGATDIAFFVDVDRQALFIRASVGPEASAADRAELEGILASIDVL